MDSNSVAFDKEHFSYFIGLAINNKMAFQALMTLFDELTPTLDKSKQLNRLLLEEIQKLALKEPIKEIHTKVSNQVENSSEELLIIGEIKNDLDTENQNDLGKEYSDSENFHQQPNEIVDRIHDQLVDEDLDEIEGNFDNKEPVGVHDKIEVAMKYVKDCMICGERFLTIEDFSKHQTIHWELDEVKEKQNQSEKDDFSRNQKGRKALVRLSCNYCSKMCQNSSLLQIHERIHTGEKPYRCKFCDRGFAQKQQLKTHERIHTGEKPYGCKYCDKSFIQKGSLDVHEKIHTGEKPFQCKTCKKSFRHQTTLQKHKRIHTGEKPIDCKMCGERFTFRNQMQRHNQKLHKSEIPS